MNKSAIKNFAVSARNKLMKAIEQKAYALGITKIEIKEPEVYQDGFRINDQFFKKYQMKQRTKLLQKIKDQGYGQVIEETAYTWFNRFIAIRFMEVNEYLPIGVRVLSSQDREKVEPDAVTSVQDIAEDLELDLEVVYRLQDENNSEELFKYILVKQCNKLGEIMPMMFEQIEDYTELLLPDQLLTEGSVVRDLVTMIEEEDWKEQVEIIGWLYQYYISEKKDQVFADLKKNKKITKENIPAATQLFTPKWIVQYMVENSLGRLWLESHPDEDLQKEWKYYLEEAEQEPEVKEQLEKLKNKELSPEEIKVLDPCMGSGHILVYAFDVLYKIYQNAGYAERDISKLILEKNLYGLDIDDRAAQLAYFALMMKARSYNRRIFRKKLDLNICAVQESNGISEEALEYFVGDSLNKEDVEYIVDVFTDAKEYGSILNMHPIQFDAIKQRLEEIKGNEEISDMFALEYRDMSIEKLPALVKQAMIMCQKYDVVVTNPPYMGTKGMNDKLNNYLKKNHPNAKSDLFATFIEMIDKLTRIEGISATINQHSWMFLPSFKNLREWIINTQTIFSMVHLGAKAFEEIAGEVVQTTSYVIRKRTFPKYKSIYVRLTSFSNATKKRQEFFNQNNKYIISQSIFSSIPGAPIAYWASNNLREAFNNYKSLDTISTLRVGLQTGDNERFLKLWHEIDFTKVGLGIGSTDESKASQKKWFPYNKGGKFRKWYGNLDYVVNWENDGQEIKEYGHYLNSTKKPSSRMGIANNSEYYFKESLTWSTLGTNNFGVRFSPKGAIFDNKGSSLFNDSTDMLKVILGALHSKTTKSFLSFLTPTVDFVVGQISKLPFSNLKIDSKVIQIVDQNILIAKKDWDSFETSWNFKRHPLILFNKVNYLSNAFSIWKDYTIERFCKIKANEEELNRIFIEIYGLQEELTPEVDEKDITIRKADKERDIKSFISYAVGCMFGRYSLEQEGLIFSGGDFDESKYLTFKADLDNVIPITDDEYFEDDIVSRFIDFARITFSEETLEENLDFIADALTRKANETSRQRIRRYFLKEFYKEHLQTYQKRPIYWLFDSGKQDGFRALIYMHRYDSGTVACVRTDYLHTLQRKYEAVMARLDLIQEADVSTQEKTKAKKQKEKIQKQLLECQQYDQVIAHVAHQQIEIDLDDGVKVNYAKFQNIEVPQGEGRKPLKANLLAKI